MVIEWASVPDLVAEESETRTFVMVRPAACVTRTGTVAFVVYGAPAATLTLHVAGPSTLNEVLVGTDQLPTTARHWAYTVRLPRLVEPPTDGSSRRHAMWAVDG